MINNFTPASEIIEPNGTIYPSVKRGDITMFSAEVAENMIKAHKASLNNIMRAHQAAERATEVVAEIVPLHTGDGDKPMTA